MLLRKIHFSLLVLLLLDSFLAMGQAARSPFSSFGIGEQYGTALTHNQGMGGVGISNPEYWYLNNQNPALLVFNRLTTFQAGVLGEQRTQSSSTTTEKTGSGNLNYLVLGIPVKPGWWVSSVALMPYSRLNYQLKYTQPVEGSATNTVNITEKGSGGINQLNWSNGVTVIRSISVGLKATYLFSSIVNEYSNVLTQTNQTILTSPKIYERTFVSDFQFSPALSIHIDSLFKQNYRLNIGAVYDFGSSLNSKFYQRIERLNAAGLVDSVTLIPNAKGTITIPQALSVGISFGKGFKWMAAVDGYYADYSQYRSLNGSNPYQTNNWRLGAGFTLTPDQASLSSYLKRMTYRTGVSLENYPYLVNGNTVRDFGITFGFSSPVSRYSSLDLALKVGKKGDKTSNTLEENYIKLYFGITFNDQWFIKRRFD